MEGFQLGDVFEPLLQNVGSSEQKFAAIPGRHVAPLVALEAATGGSYSQLDVFFASLCYFGYDLFGRGIDNLEAIPAGGSKPLVVDEQLGSHL